MPLLLAVALQAASGQALSLELLTGGLDQPTAIADPGDGSGRLFITEQSGRVRVWTGSALLPAPFLDLGALVLCCGARGLLGIVFDPGYPGNRSFYVHYNDSDGDVVVARYRTATAAANVALPDSALVLLEVPQPFGNHNGGQLAFGPDGHLYVALGDGGGVGDPFDSAQDLGSLLGKLLRIDVAAAAPGAPYAIPADNPFVGVAGARGEIWASGLRNPWRFSFDRATGDLWIGDVGLDNWEEVDLEPAGGPGGVNYGWNRMEGSHCRSGQDCSSGGPYALPVFEYPHAVGCSVTGGYHYRGTRYPALAGLYIYGDFCTGGIWGLSPTCGGGWSSTLLVASEQGIVSFGEDAAGELYLLSYPSGELYQLHATGAAPTGSDQLCLGPGGRFAASAHWRTADGTSGEGTAVALTEDTGFFWFFSPQNVELVLKVLDACVDPFQRHWVFAGGLTNVEVEITVTDTRTGAERRYLNPLGEPFQPLQDTAAFTCP